ncbi:MBL fold metallo-hydrolase [Psychrobacillus sp.]|uniref:MBL fold metallo-hydrolase n=1 Tax=Psychrobacillus sp. TaxID=1871623 RepID=UPI0028BD4224|nr:MBL fold metallo-hydrolase [Psychrobacillus sp.]
MLSRFLKVFTILILVLGLNITLVGQADATGKVMWGKTELKLGQIGKATILADTTLVKLESDGSISTVRAMKKGEEYRVYNYKGNHGGLFGVGGGNYIQKNTKVKYETPSKSKLALLGQQGQTTGNMQVHFIDVGQGDSTLIQSPDGKNILIDGGTKAAGADVVAFLKSKGVKKLDYVVATHPDADHIGGLISVINSFTVSNFVNSGNLHATQTYAELLMLVDNQNINYIEPKNEDILIGNWTSDFYLQVLYANPTAAETNDASIVIKTGFKKVDFLLMADAGVDIENYLVSNYDDISASVLKAGHHGSNTSSSASFIKAVKPSTTILSYGKDNSYGHPHAEVVKNLTAISSKIYKTATDCNITVSTNGSTHAVSNSCKKTESKPVEKPVEIPIEKPVEKPIVVPTPPVQSGFKNCTELRKAYPNGVGVGHPAYESKHDRDGDGWACEK